MRKYLIAILSLFPLCLFAIDIVYGPYLQEVTQTEATIVWVTNQKAISWVEVAPNDTQNFYAESRPAFYQTYLGKRVLGKVHKIKVQGLQPGTVYRYRVLSKEIISQKGHVISYGTVASTDVYSRPALTFQTLDPEKETLKIAVVNDIHGDNSLLTSLLQHTKKENMDFVFFNGDMVSHMENEEQLFTGFINTAVQLFASEIPFFFVRGNHESRGDFADQYLNYFPTSTRKPYYAFRDGPAYFIVLDGGEDKPDDDIEYYGLSDFDQYRIEQAEWLKQIMQGPDFKEALFRVVLIHVPPIQSTWHGPLHVNKLFAPILNDGKIDLMICGHTHEFYYAPKGEEGCKFPILINSNKEVTKLTFNKDFLNIHVGDKEWKLPVNN